MRMSWLPRIVLGMVLCCGAPLLLGIAPTPVYAQIPDPGEPYVTGWFCPQCGGLVPTGQQTCSCGFSLSGGGGGSSTNSDGGSSSWWDRPVKPPAPPKPTAPKVSAEERRQRDIYAREKQALLEAFKLPVMELPGESQQVVTAVSAPDAFTTPLLPARMQQASGLSEAEWARARACQTEIDAITRTWPVPARDTARLDNLITERNTLWAKATSATDLTAEERERLRLRLFTAPAPTAGPVATVSAAQLAKMRETPAATATPVAGQEHPVTLAMMQQASVDYSVALVELAGEEWAGQVLGEAAGDRFGTVLGLAKVGVAVAQRDPEEGLMALADVLVGLIPFPQASGAVAGGRIYAGVAFQSMNHFMTQSMQVVGGTADVEAFWKDMDNDLNVFQRAFRKYIGFGQ